MAEYVGTASQRRIQQRLRQRQAWIAQTPGAVNAGRWMVFDDPAQVGWRRVMELANEDELVLFAMLPEDEITGEVAARFGPAWRTKSWTAYTGAPAAVIDASRRVIDRVRLPAGWRIDGLTRPNDRQIDAVQRLNSAVGLSPYPAYFSRGEAVPILTACIADGEGVLMATASAVMRYHPAGRLGGLAFVGSVSVAAEAHGRGLGKLVNAVALTQSHTALGWTTASQQVTADNAVSQAMIKRCGLSFADGVASVAAIASDEAFTR